MKKNTKIALGFSCFTALVVALTVFIYSGVASIQSPVVKNALDTVKTPPVSGQGIDDGNPPGHPAGEVLAFHEETHSAEVHTDHAHHHDAPAIDLESLIKDSWKVREHWYDEPIALNEDFYVPKNIPLELDEHCLSHPSLNSEQSFSEHISHHYGQNVFSRDSTGTFFKSIAQFFKWGNRFWQINVIWDFDMPPVYRFEFFSSTDEGFNREVVGVQSPIEFPKVSDPISTQEWLDQMVSHYASEGADIGARIVEQRVMDDEGRAHEWTSLNGQLTTWKFGTGVCVLNSSGTGGRCACENSNQQAWVDSE